MTRAKVYPYAQLMGGCAGSQLTLAFVRRLFAPAAFLCLALLVACQAKGQAVYTATGPGSYVSVGVAAAGFQQDYGHHYIGGETVYVDANLYRRFGVEAEGRLLNAHTEESVKESTYLIGLKYSGLARTFRPYVKVLAGRGTLDFPFHYAVGHYFVVAPAAGLDVHLGESRFTVRVAEFEYQLWPQFTFGELHPYGVSAGFSVDVFRPSGYIRGHRFR